MDWNELQRYIESQVKEALRQTAIEVEQIIKKYIKRVWYDAYTPKAYTRTYDYLNSLTVSKVKTVAPGRYEIDIYFDTSKIKPRPSDGVGRWPSHQNVYTGKSFAEYLPEWIEYGKLSSIYPFSTKTGGQPMTSAFKELKHTQFHLKRIQSILNSKGIFIQITGYTELKKMSK